MNETTAPRTRPKPSAGVWFVVPSRGAYQREAAPTLKTTVNDVVAKGTSPRSIANAAGRETVTRAGEPAPPRVTTPDVKAIGVKGKPLSAAFE